MALFDADFLSFHMGEEDVEYFRTQPSPLPNLFAELTFIQKYSRKLRPDDEKSPKERFWEVCVRVTNGTFSILKDHCKTSRLPWDEAKAQGQAREFCESMFRGRWSPPGRGFQMMGTEFVHERHNSAALQNCAFVSTHDAENGTDLFEAMSFLMEGSMLGIGVGFNGAAKGHYAWSLPYDDAPKVDVVIPDTREGWTDSVVALLRSLVAPFGGESANVHYVFDYTDIRDEGEPVRGFGGTASGPAPLKRLHEALLDLAKQRDGAPFEFEDVADLGNLIGQCVVAGNLRRTAEILLGDLTEVAPLKDYRWDEETGGYVGASAHRAGWGHLSNNSAFATEGEMDYGVVAELNHQRSEPGLVFMDLVRSHGRLVDPPTNDDYRAIGVNPCGEQALESFECCTLVETYPTHADSLEEYTAALKWAYLYAKSVTVLPTHWAKTNAVMQRNRRIGTSQTGLATFADQRGLPVLRQWQTAGYEAITALDKTYSEWLAIRESIKKTSIKPSGTVSKVWDVTAGVHYPVGDFWVQRLRMDKRDPVIAAASDAGYFVSEDVNDPTTSILHIPMSSPISRTQEDVSVWEKMMLAVEAQFHWADNQVSCTLSYLPEEAAELPALLRAFEGKYKAISFMPIEHSRTATDEFVDLDRQDAYRALDRQEVGGYVQVPMHPISRATYEKLCTGLGPVDLAALYEGLVKTSEVEAELFCSNDVCEVPA